MNRFEELKIVELGEKIGYKKGFEDARKQFERPHGEWLDDKRSLWDIGECSICKEITVGYKSGDYKYCPYCGADMRPKEGDEK